MKAGKLYKDQNGLVIKMLRFATEGAYFYGQVILRPSLKCNSNTDCPQDMICVNGYARSMFETQGGVGKFPINNRSWEEIQPYDNIKDTLKINVDHDWNKLSRDLVENAIYKNKELRVRENSPIRYGYISNNINTGTIVDNIYSGYISNSFRVKDANSSIYYRPNIDVGHWPIIDNPTNKSIDPIRQPKMVMTKEFFTRDDRWDNTVYKNLDKDDLIRILDGTKDIIMTKKEYELKLWRESLLQPNVSKKVYKPIPIPGVNQPLFITEDFISPVTSYEYITKFRIKGKSLIEKIREFYNF